MTLAIAVIGVTSYRRIPADILPIFKTPAVHLITFYPGMLAVVMEHDITAWLERWTIKRYWTSRGKVNNRLDYYKPNYRPRYYGHYYRPYCYKPYCE